jgi:hypothetical protein
VLPTIGSPGTTFLGRDAPRAQTRQIGTESAAVRQCGSAAGTQGRGCGGPSSSAHRPASRTPTPPQWESVVPRCRARQRAGVLQLVGTGGPWSRQRYRAAGSARGAQRAVDQGEEPAVATDSASMRCTHILGEGFTGSPVPFQARWPLASERAVGGPAGRLDRSTRPRNAFARGAVTMVSNRLSCSGAAQR